MNSDQVHRFILRLPETEEYEHGGLPSFRVRGKRFASMLDKHGINLPLPEQAIREAVAEWPDACREEWFGKRLAAVRVGFPGMDDAHVRELITEAWRSKAPRKLVRAFDEK